MNLESLKKDITNYLNILYDCKYDINIYKALKANNNVINLYPYPFIVILNSWVETCVVRLNSIIAFGNQKRISNLITNCEHNKKYVAYDNLDIVLNEINTKLDKNKKLLNNIKTWRDKNLAHSDAKYFGKIEELFKDNPIINEELISFIDSLIFSIKELYKLFECNDAYDCSTEIEEDLDNFLNTIKKKDLYK